MYYIQERSDQEKTWGYSIGIDTGWYLEFSNKTDAMACLQDMKKERSECRGRKWEYRIKKQSEYPWNMTPKHQLHIPQMWNEDKQQWRDWEADGREAVWFTNLEEAKRWVNDAIDCDSGYETLRTRIQTFDLSNPRISYKKNGR